MLNSGAAEARFLMLASSKVYVIAAWQLGMLRWSGWPGPFFNSCQLPCPGTPPAALPPLAGISFYRRLPPAAPPDQAGRPGGAAAVPGGLQRAQVRGCCLQEECAVQNQNPHCEPTGCHYTWRPQTSLTHTTAGCAEPEAAPCWQAACLAGPCCRQRNHACSSYLRSALLGAATAQPPLLA